MKYWLGYVFWISGTLLLVLPHLTIPFRFVGVAALLVGAGIGWIVRGERRGRGTTANVNHRVIESKRLVKWSLLWMLVYVVVVIVASVLVMFGDFDESSQMFILGGALVAVVGVPTFVLVKRYGRGS